ARLLGQTSVPRHTIPSCCYAAQKLAYRLPFISSLSPHDYRRGRFPAGLVRTTPHQHRGEGMEENHEVQLPALPLDVLDIQLRALLEVGIAAPVDLPQAGQAGAYLQSLGLPQLVCVRRERGGARANQAHVPLQHIEELRKLVQARLAQELPDAGDARVVHDLEVRPGEMVEVRVLFLQLLSVLEHRPELVHREAFTVHTGALLLEDHRAGRVQLDDQRSE